MKIKYDLSLMKLISLFERKARVNVKDAFEDKNGILYFIVNEGNARKAIGKKGENIKQLSESLKKRIKVVEFSEDMETFIKRLVFPLKINEVSSDGNVILISGEDKETNSRLIGRNGSNLRNYEDMMKRYFPIKEIKVQNRKIE